MAPGELVSMQDHDLLIQLHTKLDQVVTDLSIIKEIEYRVRTIEKKDERHSETLKALRQDVDALKAVQIQSARIDALEEDVDSLKTKSNLWDGINGIGVIIAAAIAYFTRR